MSNSEHVHSCNFVLYDTAEVGESGGHAGKLSYSDLLLALPACWPQNASFNIRTATFHTILFFAGKTDRRLSEQRFFSGQRFCCTVRDALPSGAGPKAFYRSAIHCYCSFGSLGWMYDCDCFVLLCVCSATSVATRKRTVLALCVLLGLRVCKVWSINREDMQLAHGLLSSIQSASAVGDVPPDFREPESQSRADTASLTPVGQVSCECRSVFCSVCDRSYAYALRTLMHFCVTVTFWLNVNMPWHKFCPHCAFRVPSQRHDVLLLRFEVTLFYQLSFIEMVNLSRPLELCAGRSFAMLVNAERLQLCQIRARYGNCCLLNG
jgi:hypothetical protein